MSKNALQSIALFRDLPDPILMALDQACHWATVARDRQIVGQGDSTTDVFVIAQGSVRAKMFSARGKEVSFLDITAGNIFGEFSAIDLQNRSTSVLTLSECTIGRIPATMFRQILLDHPQTAMKMIEQLVAKTRSLTDRVFEFSTLAVKNRLHAELVRLAHRDGQDDGPVHIRPAPTHYDLATRISTHREAVTRELNHLSSEGIIDFSRGHITVLDLPRLKAMVDQVVGF